MDGSSIRKVFLNFFAERDHTVVPSAPLVPAWRLAIAPWFCSNGELLSIVP